MFCIKCGGKLVDQAKFCSVCGEEVKKEFSSMEQSAQVDHALFAKEVPAQVDDDPPRDAVPVQAHSEPVVNREYLKLGGWLALVAYSQLFAVGLSGVAFLGGLFLLLRNVQYLQYMGFNYVLLTLAPLALYIPLCLYCIKFFRMIKHRDSRFLRFYEITMMILCALSVVTVLLTGITTNFRAMGASIGESLPTLLGGIVSFLIWTTYFRKSVRVHTYMGSDDYLRNSLFFKGAAAPATIGGVEGAAQRGRQRIDVGISLKHLIIQLICTLALWAGVHFTMMNHILPNHVARYFFVELIKFASYCTLISVVISAIAVFLIHRGTQERPAMYSILPGAILGIVMFLASTLLSQILGWSGGYNDIISTILNIFAFSLPIISLGQGFGLLMQKNGQSVRMIIAMLLGAAAFFLGFYLLKNHFNVDRSLPISAIVAAVVVVAANGISIAGAKK